MKQAEHVWNVNEDCFCVLILRCCRAQLHSEFNQVLMPTNLMHWTCNTRTFSSFNSQIWQRGSQHAQSNEKLKRRLAPSQENILECFCKNSWPQHCRDEQWGQIMEIPTMWTFNCFQTQLALKRERLTSSPLTNASLLREFYPLLAFS